MHTPDIDGGVVEVLSDQFFQLLLRIVVFKCGDSVDKWNFGPDHKSDTIAFGIEIC
ncbi:hypothetical protein D3C73_1592470 [compost metagenome]